MLRFPWGIPLLHHIEVARSDFTGALHDIIKCIFFFSVGFLQQLIDYVKKEQYGEIATIVGRYYAMDRDKRWERIRVSRSFPSKFSSILWDSIQWNDSLCGLPQF